MSSVTNLEFWKDQAVKAKRALNKGDALIKVQKTRLDELQATLQSLMKEVEDIKAEKVRLELDLSAEKVVVGKLTELNESLESDLKVAKRKARRSAKMAQGMTDDDFHVTTFLEAPHDEEEPTTKGETSEVCVEPIRRTSLSSHACGVKHEIHSFAGAGSTYASRRG